MFYLFLLRKIMTVILPVTETLLLSHFHSSFIFNQEFLFVCLMKSVGFKFNALGTVTESEDRVLGSSMAKRRVVQTGELLVIFRFTHYVPLSPFLSFTHRLDVPLRVLLCAICFFVLLSPSTSLHEPGMHLSFSISVTFTTANHY